MAGTGSNPSEKEVRGLRCYDDGGDIFTSVGAVLDLLCPVPEGVPEISLEIGTVYHEWAYEYVATHDPQRKLKLRAKADELALHRVTKLYDWMDVHVVKCHGAERVLVNREYRFAGRLDFFGTMDGKQSILDFKFSDRIQPRYEFQMDAYGLLLPDYPHRYLVMVPEVGVIRLFHVLNSARRRVLFLNALAVARYRVEG